MAHSIEDAIAMLDRLLHEHVVSGAQLVGGTIALALHAQRCGPAALADAAWLLDDLEALILGEIVGFDETKMERLVRVATALVAADRSASSRNPLH